MSKIKIYAILAFDAVLGFFALEIFPFAYMIVANTTKGSGNNSDGEMFIPVGYVLFVLVPIIILVYNWYFCKKHYMKTWLFIVIAVASFLVGGIIAICDWSNYSAYPRFF